MKLGIEGWRLGIGVGLTGLVFEVGVIGIGGDMVGGRGGGSDRLRRRGRQRFCAFVWIFIFYFVFVFLLDLQEQSYFVFVREYLFDFEDF